MYVCNWPPSIHQIETIDVQFKDIVKLSVTLSRDANFIWMSENEGETLTGTISECDKSERFFQIVTNSLQIYQDKTIIPHEPTIT